MEIVNRLLGLLLAGLACGASAGEVQVAVAANFAGAMQKIATAFEEDTGHKALLAIGSTGRFYAQVRNGAPFEVLLAADNETPERLELDGFAVPRTRFVYATGTLVLWSPRPGFVDRNGKVLLEANFDRIALADPRLAPYGLAAHETLRSMNVAQRLEHKVVQGENIAQAHQFVATGNAQLGFVALSQVLQDGKIAGSAWVVPPGKHAPIRQGAVLLAKGKDNPAATALMQYLRGDKVRAILRSHGYQ